MTKKISLLEHFARMQPMPAPLMWEILDKPQANEEESKVEESDNPESTAKQPLYTEVSDVGN